MNLVGPLSKLTKTAKAGATIVKTAPFYSALDEALVNLARPKGTGAEFLRELSKTPGVKPAEIADRKLAKAFEAKGKMTKEDAIKLAREYPPPKLHEAVNKDLTDEQLLQKADEVAHVWGYEDYYDMPHDLQRKADNMLENMQTQHARWQLPGGENYREIKMKLPSFSDEDNQMLMKLEADQRRIDPTFWKTSGDAYRLRQLQEKKAKIGEHFYAPAHWGDEPNVLAHMRVSDREVPTTGYAVVNTRSGNKSEVFKTPEEAQQYMEALPESLRGSVVIREAKGKPQKILHVEEIQSDWHQAGRQKGYASEEKPIRMAGEVVPLDDGTYGVKWQNGSMDSLGWGKSHAERLAQQGKLTGVVPDAPFKKNWHELAMKRLLNYAADNGYDSIAITPGAEQAKRYDLSKQISEIKYDPETYNFFAKGANGEVVKRGYVPPEELPDYVGKDMAEKIAAGGNFTGLDLQVGGEGMKGFYDQMLPSYLNQFGKKHGAQVGQVQVPVGPEPYTMGEVASHHGITPEQWAALEYTDRQGLEKQFSQARSIRPLHHFPITPTMREELTTKGTPLYQQIGIPTAGVGAASQMEEQPEVKKADGGAVNYNTSPDMSDGGRIIQGTPFKRGGKVNLTTNRDTMLLELSKLKRK